jgi:hypothetical protein
MNPKQVWSLVGLLILAYAITAQTQVPPRDEYQFSASATLVALTRGQQDSVKLVVIRSRAFKTGTASIALNAPTAAGLTLSLRQLTHPDEYMIYLSASTEAAPGEYNFVPTCSLRNKNKGIVLKLIIN